MTSDPDSDNVLEVDNFESLMMSMDKGSVLGTSSATSDADHSMEGEKAFTREELFDEKRKSKLQAESKEIDRSNLKKVVHRKGFIKFESYEHKLRLMDTALFLFGLKLHNQEGHVKFYDADFLNTV